jgi:4-alpha-glucanotransferase
MKFPRSSGILLHPTSLPGQFGIGDLGPEAYHFVDFLHTAGQRIWQVLPLGPTGYGDSPYQSFSAFAGNPMLISPEKLVEHGYLPAADLLTGEVFPPEEVDFGRVIPLKTGMLRKAFTRFEPTAEFDDFCARHAHWLEDYVRFLALKKANGGKAWTEWTIKQADSEEMDTQRFWQYEFFRQWDELKRYCEERRIRVMGDMPIYVAGDSADVWAHPDLFELDAHGNAAMVSGVPPDYFTADGQLWGNPVYRWDRLAATGYAWWIERFQAVFTTVDMVRLDHFRGFEAFWEVPATEKTAVNGRWVKGPGPKLFEAVQKQLGELPIVAENLGVITPEVEAIRHQFGFPGMSVLQFAFGTDPQAPTFQPHNYPREVVAYTGTHDNDTTMGWWNSTATVDSTRTQEDIDREREFTKAYLATDGREINWTFIRTLFASVADTAIVPLQDVLGLGNEARMNLPGSTKRNWVWRFAPGVLTPEIAQRLKRFVTLYER